MLLNNKPPLRSGPCALAPRVVKHQRRVSTARLPCVAVAWGAQRWCFGRLQRKAKRSRDFEIQEIEGKGLGAVAQRDIPRGDQILADQPLLTIPCEEMQHLQL
eukprot:symbB.v1.2.031306.t1/scaffold3621.1/size53154/1